jgi:peptidoglycan glycosyltransferase
MKNYLHSRLRLVAMVFLGLYIVLGLYFAYGQVFYGNRWFARSSNPRSHFVTVDPSVVPGDILDRGGERLAYSMTSTYQDDAGKSHLKLTRDYCPDIRAASHVVGFQDPDKGQAGAEAFYSRYLLGYNNNLFESIYQKAFLHQEVGNSVQLTVDLGLQKDVTYIMGGRTGSAVILDAETGEVYAMVSLPNFDPADVGDVAGDDLVNRATEGLYAPGSVMKIVTASSALLHIPDIESRTWTCGGTVDIDDQTIPCYGMHAHGTVDLTQAFALSCNTTFSKIGTEIGWKDLRDTARRFGFEYPFLFSDMQLTESRLSQEDELSDDWLAWTAIGQDDVLTSPMHMAMIAACIGNGGVMMEPRMLMAVYNRNDRMIRRPDPHKFRKVIEPEIAGKIKDMMARTVTSGTGTRAAIEGAKVYGKTGTAEKIVDGRPGNNAWFVGFAEKGNRTLAVAVVIEDAGPGETGGGVAAPKAGRMLECAFERIQ